MCPSDNFLSFGKKKREDAQCPHCGSLERHRFLYIYIERKTDFFNDNLKWVLHVSPEKCFENKFICQFGDRYITADLKKDNVKVKMDITNIEYADRSFDIIICSHVLEHIEDDGKALQELSRVLKPNGDALILVPITVNKTYEDKNIITDSERIKAFGQKDHVRRYGHDFYNRLFLSGFEIRRFGAMDIVTTNEFEQMGLNHSGHIFHCTLR